MIGSLQGADAWLAGLVSDRVSDPVERARHRRFIVARMALAALALACLPPYLLWRGVPSVPEALGLGFLVSPLLAALVLARSGRLGLAHAISSVSVTGFVVCLAAGSGGSASPATIWLVAVPFEALLSGSRPAALAAVGAAVTGALGLAALDVGGGLHAAEPWPVALALPVFALSALAHATALALEQARAEGRRRSEASTRAAEDRSALQAIDDLVTWHDRNGGVIKASAGAAKLVGASAASLQGRGLFARVHVSDRPAFLKAISDAALGPAPVAVQFRLHLDPARAEGGRGPGDRGPEEEREGARVIWAEMRAHRMDSPQAEAGPAVVAVTRDVSSRKRHEEELERARADAERADASKGRFLATVSHELRTPLNAIIGFSEILAAETGFEMGPERRREYAGIIHGSGHHLLGVVNTLLDMSKIETGNFDFSPEPFDPAALAHGCCDLMQLRADQAGVALLREVAADLPELVADGRACRQILINLVSNAVKFTGRGGQVRVSLRRERDRVVFQVSDTGIGIAESDLPKLGVPFFQAGHAYARPHDGTGLGLSVVRGLVGLHGGQMSMESGMGEGTSVTVVLPLDCRTGARRGVPAPIPIHAVARPKAAVIRAG